MKVRSSRVLGIVFALLAVAIAFVSWSALRESVVAEPVAPPTVGVGLSSAAEPAPTLALPAPTPEVSKAAALAETASKERVAVATSADLELAEAIWISGQMVFPEGTPIGEQVDVIAKGRAFKSREMHRARVEANGSFRVALAPKSRTVRLEIDAPHLFLAKPVDVKIKDGRPANEVRIEPVLGGRLIVQLRMPPGAESVAAELIGKSVNSWGRGERSDTSSNRSAKIDSDLRFELRGLDPEFPQNVHFDSGVLPQAQLDDIKVQAGVTSRLEMPLSMGVRLRGRVTSPGATPKDMHLSIRTEVQRTPDEVRDNVGRGSIELIRSIQGDGGFDVRGVSAGKVRLRASATQRARAELELGVLGDGEVREGLELVLGMGGQISGWVVWPDERPAAGARIDLDLASGEDPSQGFYITGSRANDIGEVLSDENGLFVINGLEGGPFHVLAAANPPSDPKKKSRAPSWKARLENVAIDSRELKLVLQGGYSVSGIAINDLGAPIEKFSVSATPEETGRLDESKTVSRRFSSNDGRFELDGLIEGVHELKLIVMRHEPAEPIRIRVPAESGPFTLVATRRAALSGFVFLPDGSPAPRASLHVMEQVRTSRDSVERKADAQGEFKLTSVVPGSITLHAKLAGHGSSELLPLQLSPGQSIEGLRLVLRRGARISGEVHPAREGETISNRDVYGYVQDGSSYVSGSTDDKGRFLFKDVDPGEYLISLEPSPEERERFMRPDADPDEGWGFASAITRTATVRVEEGGEAHVVFGSPEPARVRISGIVRRGDAPLPSVIVRATLVDAADPRDAAHAMSDASGRFELMVVRPGKYHVQALPNGSRGMPVGPMLDVPFGGLDGVELSLPSGRISGHVHVGSNAAKGWIQVALKQGERDHAWGGTDEGAWPDADFKFEDLSAGSYTLSASAWVADSTGQPRKVLGPVEKKIELKEGQVIEDIRFEVGNR